MTVKILVFAMVVMAAWAACAADLPDSAKTPGEANPVLTQELVCSTGFRTGPYRNVPAALKSSVYKSYGMTRKDCRRACKRGCEVDHLISLELGGANTANNLWPQSYCGPWSAVKKDELENELHKLVCSGELTLEEAQTCISSDWKSCYMLHMN
jgi:hypothetical protein